MTFQDDLAAMGAVPTALTISAELKNTGTSGNFVSVTVSLGANADFETVEAALIAHVQAQVGQDGVLQSNVVEDSLTVAPGEPWGEPGFGPAGGNGASNGGGTEQIVKYQLTPKPDDKMYLELFPLLGDGNAGRYPEIMHTCSTADMRALMSLVMQDVTKPPSAGAVQWLASWSQGRKKKQGEGFYKDLTGLSRVP